MISTISDREPPLPRPSREQAQEPSAQSGSYAGGTTQGTTGNHAPEAAVPGWVVTGRNHPGPSLRLGWQERAPGRLKSIRARVAVLVCCLSLMGCSQAQIAAWVRWYEQDPVAATEFANRPEVQADLATGDHERESNLRNNHAQRWEQIAWCESGRQWSLRATNRTGTYGGGLMIRDNVWAEYGGREFAHTADQASKAQQIEVAERILEDVGWRAWDCA